MKKFVSDLFALAMLLLMVWLVLSWFNIAANNTTLNPVYADWNLFILLLK